jgi:hypothetical protein
MVWVGLSRIKAVVARRPNAISLGVGAAIEVGAGVELPEWRVGRRMAGAESQSTSVDYGLGALTATKHRPYPGFEGGSSSGTRWPSRLAGYP